MVSFCKTMFLWIIKHIYHLSLYLVKYPQQPSELECQINDLVERVSDLEDTLTTVTILKIKKELYKGLYNELYDELKPLSEYVELKTFHRHNSIINDRVSILQKDVESLLPTKN